MHAGSLPEKSKFVRKSEKVVEPKSFKYIPYILNTPIILYPTLIAYIFILKYLKSFIALSTFAIKDAHIVYYIS